MFKKLSSIFIISILSNNIFAFQYGDAEIYARASVNDSFNLPRFSFVSNSSPVINELGEVGFKVILSEEENAQGLWLKTNLDPNGKILFKTDATKVLTDPTINNEGFLGFSLFDDVSGDGIYLLDGKLLSSSRVFIDENLFKYYTYPIILNSKELLFRATDHQDNRGIYLVSSDYQNMKTIISEGDQNLGSNTSYIFKPAHNSSGTIAFKRRLGRKGDFDESAPDQIVLIRTGLKENDPKYFEVIISDKDFNPKSEIVSINNTVSISSDEHISFVARNTDGRLGLYHYYQNNLSLITLEGENGILNIEPFSSKVIKSGYVYFRAISDSMKRGIYFYDQSGISKIIEEGDFVQTDIGEGKILKNRHYPAFGGDFDVNDNGQLVFNAVLQNKDDREIGQGIFLIQPK